MPKGATGRPRSGSRARGEIYVDKNATLWKCTANGNPETGIDNRLSAVSSGGGTW